MKRPAPLPTPSATPSLFERFLPIGTPLISGGLLRRHRARAFVAGALALASAQQQPVRTPCDRSWLVGADVATLHQSHATVAHAVDSLLAALGYVLDSAASKNDRRVTRLRPGWPKGTENERWHGAVSPGVKLIVVLQPQGDSTTVIVDAQIGCGSQASRGRAESGHALLTLKLTAELQINNALTALPAVFAPDDTVGWVPDSLVKGRYTDSELPASTRIRFRNGRTLDTGLWEVELLKVFSTRRGVPYLVLLGRSCTECDAELRAVYIRTPFELPVPHHGGIRGLFMAAGISRGIWGGTEDWVDSVASDTRAFLGACLSPHGQDYVAFERYRSENGWQILTRIGSIVSDNLQERTLEGSWASLDSVLARTKKGACKELPRLEQVTPP